jgi:hypothetical protein
LNLQEIKYIQKIENLNQLPLDGEDGGEGELDAPRKRNGERKARAMLTVDETRDGGGRPDNDGIQTRRRRGFGQRRQRGRDGARRGEAVRTAAAARSARGRSERRCTVGTPARRVAATRQWRAARRARRGQRRLTGGTHLLAFSELKLPRTKIAQNK